jgi:hypothetical protein
MTRPVWIGSHGESRVGHSGDLCQMLDDLKIDRLTPDPPSWYQDFKRGVMETYLQSYKDQQYDPCVLQGRGRNHR